MRNIKIPKHKQEKIVDFLLKVTENKLNALENELTEYIEVELARLQSKLNVSEDLQLLFDKRNRFCLGGDGFNYKSIDTKKCYIFGYYILSDLEKLQHLIDNYSDFKKEIRNKYNKYDKYKDKYRDLYNNTKQAVQTLGWSKKVQTTFNISDVDMCKLLDVSNNLPVVQYNDLVMSLQNQPI